jgi:hypothetical protein
MNVPIRVLGIATVILWVFLVAFIVVAAYSFKDLNLGAGDPQFSTSPDGKLTFSMPINIDNKGVCSLKDLQINTKFSDAEGSEISSSSTFVPVILHGQNTTVIHNASLSIKELLDKEEYLFEDKNLAASITAGLTFAELLPVEITANLTYPWGAPFYGFTLGQPSYHPVNSTHGSISVPANFENHAAFNITGEMRTELCGSDESVLSEAQTTFDVPPQSVYDGEFRFIIPLDPASTTTFRDSHFNVYFSTSLFEYGPLVIPYG